MLGVELEELGVLVVLAVLEVLPVLGVAAVPAVVDDEVSLEPPLFSLFDPLSADAAGLSAFAALSALPPSDFGAEPFSPFG